MGDRLSKGRTIEDRVSAHDVLEALPDAVVVVDGAGVLIQLNRGAERLFGYDRGEMEGRPFNVLLAGHPSPPAPPGVAPGIAQGLRKDGTRIPVEIRTSALTAWAGSVTVVAIRDVSERTPPEVERTRQVRERALFAEISRLARKDALTGLPNRTVLHDRVRAAIAAARRDGHRLAVLLLDLDRFKQINESLGHAIGDWLLESVALRLTATVGGDDTVSRQGGDEFVILLAQVRDRDEIARRAERIIDAVTGLHHIAGHELHVNASLGVACYPEDGEDSETLIKHADIAMYHAKNQGRDNFQFFTGEMNAYVVERQALEHSLRGALRRGELVLHYQPKVNLVTGLMIGAEALVRWRHPDHGLIGPERFVPVAEESGLIVPIGQWVLREACRQAAEWQAAGLQPLPVAVNISGVELRNKSFPDDVRRILKETTLSPHHLEVELTESVLMESVGATADVLRELKATGLRLAVDDFGTGYSSLSYLAQFPIDALKVDQSFVRQIAGARESSPIITAVISMAKGLKHRVIAEGVETLAQLAFLRAEHCEEGQGFHFSRPLPPRQFADLLAAAR
ncbi:MAG: putative bifunctional diguanylate cyclase/phosphodiesterase [Bacteroidales bacterium]